MENQQSLGQSKYNLNESDFVLLGELQKAAFFYRNEKKNYTESFERWVSIRLMIDARFEKEESKSCGQGTD